MLSACLVSAVDTTCDRCCAVVVEVVVEGAVARAEALFFKEERVVEKGEGVEYIEIGLPISALLPR